MWKNPYILGTGLLGGVLLLLFFPDAESLKRIDPGFAEREVAEAEAEDSRRASILFVGDMMFDRHIRTKAEAHPEGYAHIFSGVSEVLQSADVVVGNLEGTVTDFPSRSTGTRVGDPDNTRFTFDPKIARVLKDEGIRIVNIGNNHIYDYGPEGIRQTHEHLSKGGIVFFGGPGEEYKHVRTSINGIPFIFLNFNEFSGDNASSTAAVVAECRQEGAVCVVYAHWGEEYVPDPPARIVAAARLFAEAGADVVIGSHPHVVQKSERYKEAIIYYSLGNFVFDQYFSSSTARGLMVRMDFEEGKAPEVFEYPVLMRPEGSTALLP